MVHLYGGRYLVRGNHVQCTGCQQHSKQLTQIGVGTWQAQHACPQYNGPLPKYPPGWLLALWASRRKAQQGKVSAHNARVAWH